MPHLHAISQLLRNMKSSLALQLFFLSSINISLQLALLPSTQTFNQHHCYFFPKQKQTSSSPVHCLSNGSLSSQCQCLPGTTYSRRSSSTHPGQHHAPLVPNNLHPDIIRTRSHTRGSPIHHNASAQPRRLGLLPPLPDQRKPNIHLHHARPRRPLLRPVPSPLALPHRHRRRNQGHPIAYVRANFPAIPRRLERVVPRQHHRVPHIPTANPCPRFFKPHHRPRRTFLAGRAGRPFGHERFLLPLGP